VKKKISMIATMFWAKVNAVAVAAAAVATVVSGGIVQDWPHWRGPDQHSGIVEETSIKTLAGACILWSASIGPGLSAMVVSGDRAVTMGYKDKQDQVICFDGKSGKEFWRVSYDADLDANSYSGGPNATPTIANGNVYTLGKQGIACCISLKSGEIVWKRNIPRDEGHEGPDGWGCSGSPAIWDDLVVYNLGADGIALNRITGATVWVSAPGKTTQTSPMLFPDGASTNLIILHRDFLKCSNPRTGKLIWEYPWKAYLGKLASNMASPVWADNGFFVSSCYSKNASALIALNNRVPELKWTNTTYYCHTSLPIYFKGHLYGISGYMGGTHANSRQFKGPAHEGLFCAETATGALTWKVRKEDFPISASPILIGETLLYVTLDGCLILARANPEKFDLLGRMPVLSKLCWTSPSYSNGRIFVRNDVGNVVCVQLGNE